MAGHSKWANIKFRKAGQDAKRGKLFTKLIREITVSAKSGGGDVSSNPTLRTAIDKALNANMTRDTIDRAIKRGAGGDEGQHLEVVRYEGYGPAGVAIMVDCLTDNRNRTVSEVRHCLTKHGGNLGTDGSVSYLFTQIGQLVFEPGVNEDKVMEIAIEVGAEDVIIGDDGSIEVRTAPRADVLNQVVDAFKRADLHPVQSAITQLPATEITLDQETAEKYLKLVDQLEDLDDVQEVYSNATIAEDILANIGN